MAVAVPNGGPSAGALTEVLGLLLERGVVIEAFVRVSLVGIEVLTIDSRIVVAGVDTYLRYAEAAGRVAAHGVPELVAGARALDSLASTPAPQAVRK
jgi:gas vesicle structural protein